MEPILVAGILHLAGYEAHTGDLTRFMGGVKG